MITWWCTALTRPWTWQWVPYPGIWLATILPIVLYARAVVRGPRPIDWRRLGLFVAGMIAFWGATDWPLGTLGAGYLASAHMTQFLIYTLVSAPLLLMGTPQWMAERLTSRWGLDRMARFLGSNLVVTGLIYNTILLTTHAPGTVQALRTNQFGSFVMDILWIIAGLILWLPILSPLPDGRPRSHWAKMGYLFLTTSVVAVIPASFLTFTRTPIYAIYELAPRVSAMTAIEDQQLAGIIMKIATIPIIWSTIAVLWFRWTAQEAATA